LYPRRSSLPNFLLHQILWCHSLLISFDSF
jgi:hypothetical protein